ncbi:MAG: conjugal transfer protein TraF [Elusimicrobiota bacterium]|jgi:hypothetical protein|nr:conjugal transfer protein TraF [Elusimicrobiota bacterium]
MKKLFLAALFVFPAAAFAQPWQLVGSRAMGMGGAGVATAYGPDAQYWNPAGLVQKENLNESGFAITGGVSIETAKTVLSSADKLSEMADKYKHLASAINSGDNPDAQDIETLFEGLADLSSLNGKNLGALINADAGVGLKIKNFAFSVRSLGNAGITPIIDTTNIGLGTQGGGTGLDIGTTTSLTGDSQTAADILAGAIDDNSLLASLNTLFGTSYSSPDLANAFVSAALSAGSSAAEILAAAQAAAENMPSAASIINNAASASGSYKDNESRVMVDMGVFSEASLGYGFALTKGLQFGANIKVIQGEMAQTGILVLQDNEDIQDILDDALDNKTNSTQFGVDLGAMLNFSDLFDRGIWLNPQVGVTAKNINRPRFERPNAPAGLTQYWQSGKYALEPQVRAGAAINPFKFMTLAADLDLTKNTTLARNFDSRQLAVGLEVNVVNKPKFNLPLRVGLNKNLANSEAAAYYTAGLGLNMLHFHLELAGALSSEETTIDGTKVPASAGASLMLALLF